MIPRLPRAAWIVLAGDALSALGTGMTLPLLLVYLHSVRGLSLALAGLAVSTIALASLVGNPLGGSLADRFGARDALIVGLVIAAGGAILLLAVRQPWHAFGATAIVGLGASIAWPAQDALLATVAGEHHGSSVFSMRYATMNAGLGAGAVIAATIVNTHRPGTFTILYLADAITFLVFIPVLATVANPRPGHDARDAPPPRATFASVARDPIFIRLWVLFALVVTISYGQLNSAFPAYATRPGHISASGLSVAYALNAITVVFAQLVTLRLLRGHRRSTAITLACLVFALAWAITLAAGQLGHSTSARLLFAAALIVFALAETMLSPTFAPIVNDIASQHLRGRYNGLATLAYTTGFLIGPAIAGITLNAHLDSSLFVGLILACGVAAVGAGRLAPHLPRPANTIEDPQDRATATQSTPASKHEDRAWQATVPVDPLSPSPSDT